MQSGPSWKPLVPAANREPIDIRGTVNAILFQPRRPSMASSAVRFGRGSRRPTGQTAALWSLRARTLFSRRGRRLRLLLLSAAHRRTRRRSHWRCLTGSALAPSPHPAHRTGHADLPHPALGQDITPSPTTRRAQFGSDVRARSARRGARVDRSRLCVA